MCALLNKYFLQFVLLYVLNKIDKQTQLRAFPRLNSFNEVHLAFALML